MKSKVLLLTMVLAAWTLTGISYAQDSDMGPGIDKDPMMKDYHGYHHGMGDKKTGMCPLQSSGQVTMVAASDGGVIVLSGNKLTKYDKNLNVVKEIEIKGHDCSQCQMQGKMGCPHMGSDLSLPPGHPDISGAAAEPGNK